MKSNLDIYQPIGKSKNLKAVVDYFNDTLLVTNRRWSFYVNWQKVRDLTEKYRIELGILEAALDLNKKEFGKIIKKYPEVVRVFPRLMAVRDDKFSVLISPITTESYEYDFTKLPTNDKEISAYVKYWTESGLWDALKEVKNLKDYFYGVEVGSDTNARKNRGGKEWEDLIEPLIRDIAERNGYKLAVRQKFEKLMKSIGTTEVPKDLRRNMDFIVYKGKKFVDIEANFFSDSGTKLEVPGAYINRNSRADFELSLFLFTDGFGWKKARNLVEDFFQNFPCVVNYQMAKDGVLEKALQKYLD